jgi:hypothetical protein
VAFFAIYTAIGMILTLHYNLVDDDGPSRVANAGYVIFSRDPHVAAVGFVWNPLPSLSEIPILVFKNLWPPLLSRGQAGTFMAAGFMAAAVVELRNILLDREVPQPWRICLLGAFALNPMIIVYGGNGMSEAPFMFFTLWAARRLLLWIRSDRASDLALAGLALGLDYLTRYEAAAAAAGAVGVVVVLSTLRGPGRELVPRFRTALLDGVIVGFPFAVCFIAWTIASWLVTGIALQQFSGQYGNSSQISNSAAGVAEFQQLAGGPATIVLRDILYLEPFFPLIAIVVVLFAVQRAEVDALVPIGVFGAVLCFEAYAQLKGATFAWFRFFLMTVPLTIVLASLIWSLPADRPRIGASPSEATLSGGHPLRRARFAPHPPQTWLWRKLSALVAFVITPSRGRSTLGGAAITLCLLVSLPTSWWGMLNPLVGTQAEQSGLCAIANPKKCPVQPSSLRNNWYVASYLDRLNLPNGSVLMDTFTGWDVWLASSNHLQYTITSDDDFIAAVNDPRAYGIRYILVSDPAEDGAADAINKRYPTLYKDGAGIATLVMSVTSTGDDITMRLYRLNP